MDDIVNSNQNLTFEDVKKAVGDIDPHLTNMSRLRKQLGRGSFGTIQKHLNTLRNQCIKANLPEAVPIPAAPPELLAMWGAAVGVAISQVRARLDSVVCARDTLVQELQSARGDVLAFADELESASNRAETAEQATASAIARHKAAQDVHTAETAALRVELTAAEHRVEKTRLEAQVGAQALQSTIDGLTDKVGELKSLLHTTRLAGASA